MFTRAREREVAWGVPAYTIRCLTSVSHLLQAVRKAFSVGVKGALFQTVKGKGQDCFLGCGLGGTSLINGGVFLRPDNRVLRGLEWPEAIRNGRDALSKGNVLRNY
jgi:hypothetical protein